MPFNQVVRLTLLTFSGLFIPSLVCSLSGQEDPLTFEKDIRPILRAYCLDCHGAEHEIKGKLDLRLRRFMVQGGKTGPAVQPGNTEGSLLLQRLRDKEMPPQGETLTDEEISIIEKWIRQGAKTARPEPESIDPGLRITEEERAFWSFQSVKRPEQIPYSDHAQVRTPVDALLLKSMHLKDLTFSPHASKLTLMKRVYFDLVGLPPSTEEIQKFLAESSPDAYERLVNRLLASPQYGERWAPNGCGWNGKRCRG